MPRVASFPEKAPVKTGSGSSRKGIITEKGARDRELYLAWRAIPALLRTLPEADIKKMGYDVDDPGFMKLLGIRTRKEFCAAFGIGVNRPTEWEKDPAFLKLSNEAGIQANVLRFKTDVDFSFTQKVIRHGDARRVQLWKELYEGWIPRMETKNVNLNMTPADLVESIEARNAELRKNQGA